jgi:hypothetical protein
MHVTLCFADLLQTVDESGLCDSDYSDKAGCKEVKTQLV